MGDFFLKAKSLTILTVYQFYSGYCTRLAQTVTDFTDTSHSESAKSTTTTVLYGIFSSENSYPCAVTYSVRSHFFNFPNLIFCNIRIIELLKYICRQTDRLQTAHIVLLIDFHQL